MNSSNFHSRAADQLKLNQSGLAIYLLDSTDSMQAVESCAIRVEPLLQNKVQATFPPVFMTGKDAVISWTSVGQGEGCWMMVGDDGMIMTMQGYEFTPGANQVTIPANVLSPGSSCYFILLNDNFETIPGFVLK